MATKFGKDYKIFVSDGAGTPVFSAIEGEVTFTVSRQSAEIDTTSKGDGIYGSGSYGKQTITISVSGVTKLPDDGLENADTASKATPPHQDIQIRKTPFSTGDKVFECEMGIGNFSLTYDQGDKSTFSFDMRNTGAPTTDTLLA